MSEIKFRDQVIWMDRDEIKMIVQSVHGESVKCFWLDKHGTPHERNFDVNQLKKV